MRASVCCACGRAGGRAESNGYAGQLRCDVCVLAGALGERERDRARQRECECRIIVVPDNVRVCSGNNFGSANVFGGPVQLISSGGQFFAGQCSAVILNRSWVRREGGRGTALDWRATGVCVCTIDRQWVEG